MSSWSGQHPPPPSRGERSRSPRSAHGRGSYPDPAYPYDQYRGDWDNYSRERPWSDVERDRATYDYSRRGRSRSPPPDDRRKRRRSPSPYDRERFDPRPRYNDDYDAHSRNHGHVSPRARGYSHSYPQRQSRAPVDPHTLDFPASLKQYAEWFRYTYPQAASDEDIADKTAEQEAGDGSKPRNGIKARWEKYKKDFLAMQLQTLFDHHKKSPWFAEKYDPSPEFANLRKRVRKVGWRGRLNQFLNELEEGKFDASHDNDTEFESSSPPSPSKDKGGLFAPSNVNADSSDKKDKDEDDFNIEGDEEAADNGDVKPESNGKSSRDGKQSSRTDEVSVFPEGNQIMIRTIPPDIGRVKLENAMKELPGFVYLALGDPMQKRNYYRAGWIRFTEDADVTSVINTLSEKKIEGFKLHVTHSTRAYTAKVRQTPDIASRPERIVKDLEQVKILASILEEESEKLRNFVPAKHVTVPKDDQNTEVVGVTSTDDDVLMADALKVEDPIPWEKGSDAIERRLAKLYGELPEPTNDSDASLLEHRKSTMALDLYLAYLRSAFHTCYYCASTSDHIEELQRKCIKHVRKPLPKSVLVENAHSAEADVRMSDEVKDNDKSKDEATENNQEKARENPGKDKGESKDWKRNDEKWLDWLDAKIALLINRDKIDVRDYGGKNYDEELTKAVEPHIKQEDEGKFRCKVCSKLFKATSFIEKHVSNKHQELLKQLDDIPYFNNFALDPQRIQPFSHPPPPVGNSQTAPPQAYGLQGPPHPDHMRGMPPPGMFYPQYPPPYPPYVGGPWDPYAFPPYGMVHPPRNMRDEIPLSAGGRRLSDRIGGMAPGEAHGLPPKPMAAMDASPTSGRKNGRSGGPPPPPPPDAKEDPRAAAGRKVSYHDMDLVAEGDVELQY